jgi:hypothetical protein
MATTDRHQSAVDATGWQFPPRLEGAVDDRDDPEQFTVFPRAGIDVTTRWLSVDLDIVVDLEEMA